MIDEMLTKEQVLVVPDTFGILLSGLFEKKEKLDVVRYPANYIPSGMLGEDFDGETEEEMRVRLAFERNHRD